MQCKGFKIWNHSKGLECDRMTQRRLGATNISPLFRCWLQNCTHRSNKEQASNCCEIHYSTVNLDGLTLIVTWIYKAAQK